MPTRTTVTLVDDLDGSTADETVPFGTTGPTTRSTCRLTTRKRGQVPGYVVEAFEAGDASKLTDATGGRDATAAASTSPSVEAEQSATSDSGDETRGRDGLTATEREIIRRWAANEGIEVKSRGILKKDLIDNYEAWSAR